MNQFVQATLFDIEYARLRDIKQLSHASIYLQHLPAHCFHPFTFLHRELTSLQKCVCDSFDTGEWISDFVRQAGDLFCEQSKIRTRREGIRHTSSALTAGDCHLLSVVHSLVHSHEGWRTAMARLHARATASGDRTSAQFFAFWVFRTSWEVVVEESYTITVLFEKKFRVTLKVK